MKYPQSRVPTQIYSMTMIVLLHVHKCRKGDIRSTNLAIFWVNLSKRKFDKKVARPNLNRLIFCLASLTLLNETKVVKSAIYLSDIHQDFFRDGIMVCQFVPYSESCRFEPRLQQSQMKGSGTGHTFGNGFLMIKPRPIFPYFCHFSIFSVCT